MVSKEKILSATRGGLDIILDLYPQARVCLENKQAKFKKRQGEATASAHLIEKDGTWYLKDFGEPGKGLNGISLWMETHHMDKERFGEACLQIAKKFGITDELDRTVNMPKFVKRDARSDEPDGVVVFRLKEKFTKEELALLGPRVTQETVDSLHWHSVEWIGTPRDRKITEKHSTDTYPIFIRECWVDGDGGAGAKPRPTEKRSEDGNENGNGFREAPEQKAKNGNGSGAGNGGGRRFYKQYEPKNTEKQYRFVYFPKGAKEPDYINGLLELQEAHAQYVEQQRLDWEISHSESQPFNEHRCKLPEVVICSGERDALCVRSHGYQPVWLNSETAQLSRHQMNQLRRYAETIYNIPDLDATGIRAGVELALKHIDVYTVWLPSWLKKYHDHRGKQRKDLRDWSDLRPDRQDFRNLLMRGKPAQFWVDKVDKNGNRRYEVDTEYLFHFLQLHGFYILHDENSKDPRFIRVEDNVVRSVTTRDIRGFVRRWAQDDDNTQHHNIRNLILNTPRLSPVSLEALQETELDFTSSSSDSQLFFFRNGTASVTSEKVDWRDRKRHALETCVWEDNVLPWNYKELPPMFSWEVKFDEDGDECIEFQIEDSRQSKFFGYLINTSRLYWRKEMEYPFKSAEERRAYRELHPFEIDGRGLSPQEQAEQKQNLLSKIFCLGYILHEYKSPSRAWALMSMDSKIGETGECNGGSGKSLFYTFLSHLRKVEHKSGRAGDLTKNPHWLDRVDQFTQILEIDDMDERMPASFFYDNITGPMEVNPKNNRSFVIPFETSPKLGFSTNYVPSDFNPSSERRLLYMVYSDYYHAQGENTDYLETRPVFADFGKNLFDSYYTEEEWNADVNFAMQCVRFYLWLKQHHPQLKIQPPMDNIIRRKWKRDMGENFEEWAFQYFAEDSDHLDRQLVRTEVFEDFKRYSNISAVKMKGFTRKLRAFASLCPYIYEMDPEEYRNGQGRNISYEDDPTYPGKKKSVEMVYMRSVKEEERRQAERERLGANPL